MKAICDYRIHSFRNVDCKLENLGKVTALCGKNNSGKSTILNCLNRSELHYIGRRFSDVDWEIVKNSRDKAFDFSNDEEFHRKTLIGTLESRVVWYEDEFEDFFHNYIELAQSHPLALDIKTTGKIFKGFFIERHMSVLVPEHRVTSTSFTLNQAITEPKPKGGDLLPTLFNLKNGEEGSNLRTNYLRLQSIFSDITEGIEFDLSMPAGEVKADLKFRNNGDEWRLASECGFGIQQVLVLSYFAFLSKYDFILIEEPEAYVHPNLQRRLLDYMVNESEKRFVLTTHSNVLLDNTYVEKVYMVKYDDGITVNDETSKAEILSTLGYSVVDNLLSDLIVLTEGPSDIRALEVLLNKMRIYGKYNVRFFPLGGDVMGQVDLKAIVEDKNAIILIDRDDKSEAARRKLLVNAAALNIKTYRLKRYAIENYFPISSYRKVLSTRIDDALESILPDVKVEPLVLYIP